MEDVRIARRSKFLTSQPAVPAASFVQILAPRANRMSINVKCFEAGQIIAIDDYTAANNKLLIAQSSTAILQFMFHIRDFGQAIMERWYMTGGTGTGAWIFESYFDEVDLP